MSDGELNAGFYDVPRGKVAAVVTHLEMTKAPAPRGANLPEGCTFHQVISPRTDWYRAMFHFVGSADYLWFSRMLMDDATLANIITDENVAVHTIRRDGTDMALLELDFRTPGQCELMFFGVKPDLIGTGAGRALMTHAIACAFARPITRFHMKTCTFDHPAALPFYIRTGFVPISQHIDISDDPRLSGHLPMDAGPNVPILR